MKETFTEHRDLVELRLKKKSDTRVRARVTKSGSGLLVRGLTGSGSTATLSTWSLNLDTIEIIINLTLPRDVLMSYVPRPLRCTGRKRDPLSYIADVARLWETKASRYYGSKEDWSPLLMGSIMSELIKIKDYHLSEAIEGPKIQITIFQIQSLVRQSRNNLLLPTSSVDEMKGRLESGIPVAFYTQLETPSIVELQNKMATDYNSFLPPYYCIQPLWVLRKVVTETMGGTQETAQMVTYVRTDSQGKTVVSIDECLVRLTDMHYFSNFLVYLSREKALDELCEMSRIIGHASPTGSPTASPRVVLESVDDVGDGNGVGIGLRLDTSAAAAGAAAALDDADRLSARGSPRTKGGLLRVAARVVTSKK